MSQARAKVYLIMLYEVSRWLIILEVIDIRHLFVRFGDEVMDAGCVSYFIEHTSPALICDVQTFDC
jgi:hypothetical protein